LKINNYTATGRIITSTKEKYVW